MKKTILLSIVAIAAVITLSASAITIENASDLAGTVSLESTAIPALDCSMSLDQAANIYRLVPASVSDVCCKEYQIIKRKCHNSNKNSDGQRVRRFTHEGVNVNYCEDNGLVDISFSISGYKLSASKVNWEQLDSIFGK